LVHLAVMRLFARHLGRCASGRGRLTGGNAKQPVNLF
jgi:hypothetical protein